MDYRSRVVDGELSELMASLPALALEGAKGVGKTATASRRAATIQRLDDPGRRSVALADPARLRLLSLVLSHEGREACVCDLTPSFDLSQPTISHHHKVLHDSGLLDREKRGVWVYYAVRPAALAAVANLFDTAALTPA